MLTLSLDQSSIVSKSSNVAISFTQAIVIALRVAIMSAGSTQGTDVRLISAPALKETLCKVENILKGSLNWIPTPSPSVKIQIMGGKVCLRRRGKTLLLVVNKLLKTKSLLTRPAMFYLYTYSKLSRSSFEFSLKVKVMGSNPIYL